MHVLIRKVTPIQFDGLGTSDADVITNDNLLCLLYYWDEFRSRALLLLNLHLINVWQLQSDIRLDRCRIVWPEMNLQMNIHVQNYRRNVVVEKVHYQLELLRIKNSNCHVQQFLGGGVQEVRSNSLRWHRRMLLHR